MASIDKIIKTYNSVIKDAESKASNSKRAYGGYLRAMKGCLQEHITEEIIKIAWKNLKGADDRIEINSKKISIPIQESYINNIADKEVREYIRQNIKKYFYKLSVDKHVFIDGQFVMGIECKVYTENAMIKRILTDFHLLKTVNPNISCFLFQLESQLGGDYSDLSKLVYGSFATHSIMSYFEDVDLHIFTLLEGERDVNKPIHKNFKPLKRNKIENAVKLLESYLKKYL
ncbi:MAG: hypothetical protein LBB88_05415 [Planctomycetaceae bacterium]|jgi:Fe-S cluster biosynthesis and repair protein YggX|nr:hypothetical protein [Planctomycetaceae bacterium]